jgi:hypothetical protein
MSVLILNLTGNRNGFEDLFCENVKSLITSNVQIVSKRGLELFNSINLIDGFSIVVVVAHADNNSQTTTIIETGLDLEENIPSNIYEMLNSPTVLTQILGRNSVKYILLFCACSALSSELLVSVIDDDNCIGTISSKIPIYEKEYSNIAEIINLLKEKIDNGGLSKSDVDSILTNANMPALFYDENNMRVIEEDV